MVKRRAWDREQKWKSKELKLQQNFAFRLATDTVHLKVRSRDEEKKDEPYRSEIACACGEVLSVRHLLRCERLREDADEEERVMKSLKRVLCVSASGKAWYHNERWKTGAREEKGVGDLLIYFFSSSQSVDSEQFLDRCCFGGFTNQECLEKLSAVGVPKAKQEASTKRLREVLFDWSFKRWTRNRGQ